jgi:HSP20 family protein
MANIQRYNPFNDMISLREAMDRLFEDSVISPRSMTSHGMGGNLYETQDNFTLQLPAPGVKPEDIDITTQQDTVTVKWQTKFQTPENATSHWQGFQSSQFQQAFTLPTPINADQAQANLENGVLTLTLPKAEQAKARTLKVNGTQGQSQIPSHNNEQGQNQ